MHRSFWRYTFDPHDDLIDVSPRLEITEAEVHEGWLHLAENYKKYPTTMPRLLREMLASLEIAPRSSVPPDVAASAIA